MSAAPPITRLWCELAWLGGERPEPGVVIELDGERIGAVRRGAAAPPDGAVRLAGITTPGLANAHSHAFQRALRGRTEAERGTFWSWRERMYAAADRLDPESYLMLARATYAEMALAGITAVGEFHYVHHGADGVPHREPNAMGEALTEAAAQAGIRITLLDACYLQGGIGAEPEGVQRRFSDGSAEAWARRVEGLSEGPMTRVGAAIHSVRAVSPEAAATVAAWAAERSRPLHAHVSEQGAENEASLVAYGRTPTAVLSGAGALGERFTAVHATHVIDTDYALLGASGSACCLCPTTERDLADGIASASRLVDEGARLALGSDSHAVIDILEEARAVELDERLATGVRGHHGPAGLLRAATEQGHASIGWPEAGRIEPGALADLATFALDGVRLAGTEPGDALPSLLFAGSAADLRDLVVGGRFVVRDGAHLRLDVAEELDRAITRLHA